MKLRVAIVGAGLMGRWHADAAARAGGRVAVVIDPDRGRAEALAGRHGGCTAVRDLQNALTLVDVVHICSPTPTHGPVARIAIEAGRHVLIEKPIAQTFGDAAALLAMADARHVFVCPVHQFLFQDGVTRAFAELDRIGPLTHVQFTMCSAGADGLDEAGRVRIALEILPHPLSLLARLLPGRVADADWSIHHPAAGEIRALAQFGSLSASILVSMSGRPTVNRMELVGANGTIEVDLFHGFSVMVDGRVSRARKIAGPFTHAALVAAAASVNLLSRAARREPAYPGLRRLFERFYMAASGSGTPPIASSEVLDVARAGERFEQAVLDSLNGRSTLQGGKISHP
jgi:predicted dehydrogenase